MKIGYVEFALLETLLEEVLDFLEELMVDLLELLSSHIIGEVDVVEDALHREIRVVIGAQNDPLLLDCLKESVDSLSSLRQILLVLLLELVHVEFQQGLVEVSDSQVGVGLLEDDLGRVLFDQSEEEAGLGVSRVDEGDQFGSVVR